MGLYIGVMSGTSLDGIDVVLADLAHKAPRLLAARTFPFDDALRRDLLKLINSGHCRLHQLGQIDIALGHAYSEAVNQLLKDSQVSATQVQAIGSHGQTIHHSPASAYPFSMQIGNGNALAEMTGITTVTDFRQRDMLLGGQGAPLVPAFHQAVFHNPDEHRVIVNIGGISNITILPAGPDPAVSGFDTGPGNVLMDQWYQQHHDGLYDESGHWALTGNTDRRLLKMMLSDPYFQQSAPKSTGREHFNLKWLTARLVELNKPVRAECVQRTLLDVTVISIVDAITRHAGDTRAVYLCGGGAHNRVLLDALKKKLPNMKVDSTLALGLAPDWVEACAFAWLARQTLHHEPGNLPEVTGASRKTLLGAVYFSA